MLRYRRAVARLEDQISAARAAVRDLETRVEVFEAIARDAGARDIAPPPGGYLDVPAALIAAAGEHAGGAVPVRLDTPAGIVIALAEGGGDPREWWHAIAGAGQPRQGRRLRAVAS